MLPVNEPVGDGFAVHEGSKPELASSVRVAGRHATISYLVWVSTPQAGMQIQACTCDLGGGFPVANDPAASTDTCAAAAVCGWPLPVLVSNVGSVTDPQFTGSVPRDGIPASRSG